MDTSLSYNFNYFEQQKSFKIINFSSNIIKTIQNVPLVIVGVFVIPIVMIFLVPVANVLLWRLYKKLQKVISELKSDIPSFTFEQAKDGYGELASMVSYIVDIEKDIAPASGNFMIKGIYGKFCKISSALIEMKDILAKALFISSSNIPYSEKEKESLDIMNDIWGDDTDQVYARHTYYHLIKNLKKNGI